MLGETRAGAGGFGVGHRARAWRDGAAPVPRISTWRVRASTIWWRRWCASAWSSSVHDCADGGVAVALAEMAFAGRDRLPRGDRRRARVLLGVGVAGPRRAWLPSRAGPQWRSNGREPKAARVTCRPRLGAAGGDELVADGAFSVPLTVAEARWRDAIPARMAAAPPPPSDARLLRSASRSGHPIGLRYWTR